MALLEKEAVRLSESLDDYEHVSAGTRPLLRHARDRYPPGPAYKGRWLAPAGVRRCSCSLAARADLGDHRRRSGDAPPTISGLGGRDDHRLRTDVGPSSIPWRDGCGPRVDASLGSTHP